MSSETVEAAFGGGVGGQGMSENVREQDRFLPIANISRIMKKALPANAKIAKEAKETVQECVSEFISFITSEASDKCQREKRKTINGEDLLWALGTLGFEDYVEPLKLFLQKHREGDKSGTVVRNGSEEVKKEGMPNSSPQANSPGEGYLESAPPGVQMLPTPGVVHPGVMVPGAMPPGAMFPRPHQ